jgi:hypothetical protein
MAFHTAGRVQYVLRVYVILLYLLIVLNELECTKFTHESKSLRYWITRGLLYTFVGVLGLKDASNSLLG